MKVYHWYGTRPIHGRGMEMFDDSRNIIVLANSQAEAEQLATEELKEFFSQKYDARTFNVYDSPKIITRY